MARTSKLVTRGLVCDVYENPEFPDIMFFHRTDRYSIDEQIFPDQIPYKGFVTNQMSLRWKRLLEEAQIVSSNVISTSAKDLFRYGFRSPAGIGSAAVVKKCIPIPLECIVRGYYIPESPSWDSYKEDGTFHGYTLPVGLKNSERLPEPIFTPSTKNKLGKPDENVSFEKCVEILTQFILDTFTLTDGAEPERIAYKLADSLKSISLQAYTFAHNYALQKRIILADTMLEFGFLMDPESGNHQIVIINDAFTPDTTRYWDLDSYQVDRFQPAIGRQFLRRHLYWVLEWDPSKKPPHIDPFMIHRASELYIDIFQRIFDVDVVNLSTEAAWEWQKAKEEYEEEELKNRTSAEIAQYFDEM